MRRRQWRCCAKCHLWNPASMSSNNKQIQLECAALLASLLSYLTGQAISGHCVGSVNACKKTGTPLLSCMQAICTYLLCRLPLVVASNISLLAPHLGGKAYPIRSAIVTAIGHLIHRAFAPSASGTDAQGASTSSNAQLMFAVSYMLRCVLPCLLLL